MIQSARYVQVRVPHPLEGAACVLVALHVAPRALVAKGAPLATLEGRGGAITLSAPCAGRVWSTVPMLQKRFTPGEHVIGVDCAPLLHNEKGSVTVVAEGGTFAIPGTLLAWGGGSHPWMGDSEATTYCVHLHGEGDRLVAVVQTDVILYTTTTTFESYVSTNNGRTFAKHEGDLRASLPRLDVLTPS